ncbi:MAG: phosphodiester glycosidase family protein [Ruminococcaceae bacterium]|nr:phosphodiester glycosidase family protein [Oscillospiraceae bacterium]
MKKMRKILSLLLSTLMILTQLVVVSVVDIAAAEGVTGATQITTESIHLNGEDTGVTHTQMLLPKGSKYALYSDGVLNVAEISKDNGAVFKVINHGTYNWGKATVGDAAVAYNQANENSTVLAAVNACPWLMATTDYDGDHKSSTGPSVKGGAGGSMSMGFMMIDGEIWNTNWLSDENKMDNKYYTDWQVSGQSCFYVLADGTYDIGSAPNLTIAAINTANSKKVTVDGINRLPAPNSVIVYNKRAYSESLAYEDAYEVYLECATTAFGVDDSVTGTVTHIFKSGDTAKRPEIGENTVIISARGKGVSKLESCGFKVGGKVSVDVTNKSGSAGNAVQIIGGFFTLMENGRLTGQPTNQDQYPCSIVGIKENGSAILIGITSQSDKKYQGSRQMDLPSLCKELGCVDALLFDGGGSSTFVTLEEGAYIRRNGCSDGQPRVLGNSLAIVYDDYKGDDVDGSYNAASGIGLLDGEQNDNRPAGYVAPPEVFDENADLLTYPKTNIPFASVVDWINGVGLDGTPLNPYTDLASYRNLTTDVAQNAQIDGKALTTDDDYCLSISGWVQTASGQKNYYWSVDGYSWYTCVSGTTATATEEITAAAMTMTGLETLSAANGRFGKIAAGLSAYEGQTVNLYFAVADPEDTLTTILTINELTVSHKHVYDHDCDEDCNRCGETRTTVGHIYEYDCDTDCNICGTENSNIGEHTNQDGDFKCDYCGADVAGEIQSTVPTEPMTETESDSTPVSGGCSGSMAFSAMSLMIMMVCFVCLRKKEKA